MNWAGEIRQIIHGEKLQPSNWMKFIWNIIKQTWLQFDGENGINVRTIMTTESWEVTVYKNNEPRIWCFTDGEKVRLKGKENFEDYVIHTSVGFEMIRNACIQTMVRLFRETKETEQSDYKSTDHGQDLPQQ